MRECIKSRNVMLHKPGAEDGQTHAETVNDSQQLTSHTRLDLEV